MPTASNPANITVPGGPAPAPDVTVVIDEADNCTSSPVVAFVSDVSDNGNCPETITRTYSVTDDCGNTINVTQTIFITDPILPTASNPASINVQCIDDVPAPDTDVVTDEADNQGTPVVAFVSDVSDGNSCPETITRTYSVTDTCNNTINVTQLIVINDTT
ncbi:HYR-like domain-containing protein, partial [Flavivirga algicola]|nr:gliding motility-associated C-terminal domain-containing protein [Flavivirga algicola]